MPFSGSGVFNRLYNWVADRDASVPIDATKMDAEMDGMASGLTNCVTKDGQTTITANLPMATFRHTGVGNASARTDYASAADVQDATLINLSAAVGTNTRSSSVYTASASPNLTAYAAGQMFVVTFDTANASETVTLNIDSLGAKTVRGGLSSVLPRQGELGNQPRIVIYDGTDFVVVGGDETQTEDLTGDSTTDIVLDQQVAGVVSGYDIEFWLRGNPSSDGQVYLSFSDDSGTNYSDQANDWTVEHLASDGAGGVTSEQRTTDPGYRLNYYGIGGSSGDLLAHGRIMQKNGTTALHMSTFCSYGRSSGGGAYANAVNAGLTTVHGNGVDRFRIALSAGTWTDGGIVIRYVKRGGGH